MGRPRADPSSQATPDRILAAAQEEFGAVGYQQAKLADIASRAGIRRPSLLYHFSSKEELYTAAVERAFARLAQALVQTMQAQGSFEERLLCTVVGYAAFLDGEPALSRIVLRELLAAQGPGADLLLRQVVPLVDLVTRFITEQGSADIRPGLPVRDAIMTLATSLLVRSASGMLREPLWGTQDHARELARNLFLERGA